MSNVGPAAFRTHFGRTGGEGREILSFSGSTLREFHLFSVD